MLKLKNGTPESEVHWRSQNRTLIVGIRAYEKMIQPPRADRVIVVDKRLPPTFCQRLSMRELVVGGLQFGIELAGGEAVLFETEEP